MTQYFREIIKRKDLMFYLVTSGLKAQHRNSYLGYLWWLLDPVLGVGIYFFLVVVVIGRGDDPISYGGFLVVGLVAWRWLSSTVGSSAKSIARQAGIVSKVYLPKAIFPLATAVTQLINFCFGLVLIAVFLIVTQTLPGLKALWLPYIMLVQFLLLLAIGMIVAYVSVFVKDIDNALSHVMRLWFYGSPVIWERDLLPEKLNWVLNINPMSAILGSYRSILLDSGEPGLLKLTIIGIVSLILILILMYYYNRNEHKIIKVL